MSVRRLDPRLQRIVDETARVMRIDPRRILVGERTQYVVDARGIAMYLACEQGMKQEAVGADLDRDQSAVAVRCRNVRLRLKREPMLKVLVGKIRRGLQQL